MQVCECVCIHTGVCELGAQQDALPCARVCQVLLPLRLNSLGLYSLETIIPPFWNEQTEVKSGK